VLSGGIESYQLCRFKPVPADLSTAPVHKPRPFRDFFTPVFARQHRQAIAEALVSIMESIMEIVAERVGN
jgi:hypothetical protein